MTKKINSNDFLTMVKDSINLDINIDDINLINKLIEELNGEIFNIDVKENTITVFNTEENETEKMSVKDFFKFLAIENYILLTENAYSFDSQENIIKKLLSRIEKSLDIDLNFEANKRVGQLIKTTITVIHEVKHAELSNDEEEFYAQLEDF